MNLSLNTYRQEPQSKTAHYAVVLLHGYGSHGQDLISLAPHWQKILPETLFLSPDAPEPLDMMPGMGGFQWFSLANRDPQTYLEGARRAAPILDQYIDEILEQTGLSAEKLAIVGFSQGTMMALQVGLRRKDRIAGILGYSGALIDTEGLDAQVRGSEEWKPPVHLIHGDADEVVSIESYYAAQEVLRQNNYPMSGHVTPALGHGIDNDGIESGAQFLNKILK